MHTAWVSIIIYELDTINKRTWLWRASFKRVFSIFFWVSSLRVFFVTFAVKSSFGLHEYQLLQANEQHNNKVRIDCLIASLQSKQHQPEPWKLDRHAGM